MNTPLLHLSSLAVGYAGRTVLDGVDLTVTTGQWIALVGPNASGKSTLLKCLGGRLPPLRGSVDIDGHNLYSAAFSSADVPVYCASPEELPPFLTVRQCLEVHAGAHHLDGIPQGSAALAAQLGLVPHADRLVRDASLGTRQKLAIVLALMRRPRLLLLDEVFNGLDIGSGLQLRQYLRAQVDSASMSILLATHSLDIVSRCTDAFVLLEDGRLAGHWQTRDFTGPDQVAEIERTMAGRPPEAAPPTPRP